MQYFIWFFFFNLLLNRQHATQFKYQMSQRAYRKILCSAYVHHLPLGATHINTFWCILPEITYIFINGSHLNRQSVLCTYLCILDIHSFFILFLWSHTFLLLNVTYLKVCLLLDIPFQGMSPFAGHPGCLLAFAATDNVSVSYLVNLSLPACTSVYVS